MKQDIAEIAGKLTWPMRRELMRAFDTEMGGRALDCFTHRGVALALFNRNLADDAFHLTKKGLAVRAHLLAHSHPEKQA